MQLARQVGQTVRLVIVFTMYRSAVHMGTRNNTSHPTPRALLAQWCCGPEEYQELCGTARPVLAAGQQALRPGEVAPEGYSNGGISNLYMPICTVPAPTHHSNYPTPQKQPR
jgi:hypothetical protein